MLMNNSEAPPFLHNKLDYIENFKNSKFYDSATFTMVWFETQEQSPGCVL